MITFATKVATSIFLAVPSILHLLSIKRIGMKIINDKFVAGILFVIMIGGQACTPAREDLRCLPINYPSKERSDQRSYEIRSYQVEEQFNIVLDFYEQSLAPVHLPREAEAGQWQLDRVDDSQVLLSCLARINSLEIERGCIYIRNEIHSTLIETVWYFSGDAGPWCEPDLSVIR